MHWLFKALLCGRLKFSSWRTMLYSYSNITPLYNSQSSQSDFTVKNASVHKSSVNYSIMLFRRKFSRNQTYRFRKSHVWCQRPFWRLRRLSLWWFLWLSRLLSKCIIAWLVASSKIIRGAWWRHVDLEQSRFIWNIEPYKWTLKHLGEYDNKKTGYNNNHTK